MNATPRTALRVDAVGCWTLTLEAGDVLTPRLVRLDTPVVNITDGPGRRAVQRLDRLGRVVLRDAEGFPLLDAWSADSTSDCIRTIFNNGLYGSTLGLALPARKRGVYVMRGRSEAFGDVVPAPHYPRQTSARHARGLHNRC